MLRDLRIISEALEEMPWVVVKGPVLDEVVYPRPGSRAYGYLDVLVAPRDLERAVTSLEGAGATLVDRNLALARQQRRGELDLRLPGGSVLDLHWDLVNDADARRHLGQPTERLLADRLPVVLGGTPAWQLEPADAVTHLAVHMLTSGAHRLVWALDLQYSMARHDLDPAVLRERSGRLAPLVDLALARARIALPDRRRLARRTAWTAALAAYSRRRPAGSWPDDGRTGRTLFAATRPSTRASAGAYLRAVRAERKPGGGPTKAELMLPRDTPADRRAFFDHIAAECP